MKKRKATRAEQVPAGKNDAGEPLFTLREVKFDEEYEETVDTGQTRVTLEAGDRWGLRYDECQADLRPESPERSHRAPLMLLRQ